MSPRAALAALPQEAPDELRPHLCRVERRLRLGDTIERAVGSLEAQLGPDIRALQSILAIGLAVGGDLARMLDLLAGSIDQRLEAHSAAAASTAGAKLSGRMVATLPLLCVPLLPATRAPLFDPVGIALLMGGMTLACGGLKWMSRLVPTPDQSDDGAATVADVAASAIRGGAGLHTALNAIAEHPPVGVEEPLRRAARLVRFGISWGRALQRSSDASLAGLGRTLVQSEGKGLPATPSLGAYAVARRKDRARELDAAIKRAPVLMIVPLVTCVLPAFVLLGLGPFIRGLGVG